MNKKPLVLINVAAFLAMSASALADDKTRSYPPPPDPAITPLSQMTGQDMLAARIAAKKQWFSMTPHERAVAKEAARHKGSTTRTAMDEYALAHLTFDEQFEDAHRQDRDGSTKRKPAPERR